MCVLAAAVICASVTLRSKKNKKERKRKRERQGGLEWMEDCQCAAVLWRGVLRCRDNRTPAPLAYLCCTQRSCFCCLPLPAKSHPATTWGRRSAPPGPCSSSSARGQITNTNHLLILVIKGTLISSELRSSAAPNGQKHTSESIAGVCMNACACVCVVACRQWLYSGWSGDKWGLQPPLSGKERIIKPEWIQ